MKRTFIETKKFQDKWKKLGLDDTELLKLQAMLLENPDTGEVIQGTGGLRKIRWALEQKGKRGGVRVIYLDILVTSKIYLVMAYAKNEQIDLSEAQKKLLSDFVWITKKKG